MLSGLVLWPGATLALGEHRRFARRRLADRLAPYTRTVSRAADRDPMSVTSLLDAMAPIARSVGESVSRLFGVTEDLGRRLERAHAPWDATDFRLRQLGGATGAVGVGGLLVALVQPPVALGVLLLLGGPLLVFLAMEQAVSARSERWQRRVFLELPVICEQLAMLVAAGYSLGTALDRIARRGSGACAQDLRHVHDRVAQGVALGDALREWAELTGVDALDHLVAILRLHHATADLGRLLSDEATSIRRDVHRDLIETLERRAQSVWIPVTVATLVPGVILLAVPFAHALRVFTAGSA